MEVSKVVAGNSGEVAFSYHQDLICSQTDIPWSHIHLNLAGLIRSISYLILVDSYSKWPEVIPVKSAITSTVINSLRQVFTNQSVRKVIVFRNVTQFSCTRFEDSRGLDEQFVDNLKRQLFVSQAKEAAEEILYFLEFRYRTTPHIGAKMLVRHHKNLHSRFATLTCKSKANPTKIYLNICDLPSPWNSEAPETQQKTLKKIQSGSNAQTCG